MNKKYEVMNRVLGYCFDRLFDVNPNAVIYSLGKKITRHEGNWQDRNVGNDFYPKLASEQCECGEV
jgi:hypothetical protein